MRLPPVRPAGVRADPAPEPELELDLGLRGVGGARVDGPPGDDRLRLPLGTEHDQRSSLRVGLQPDAGRVAADELGRPGGCGEERRSQGADGDCGSPPSCVAPHPDASSTAGVLSS